MGVPARHDAGGGLGGKLAWTSKHGSLAASVHDLTTVDGLNDAGLGAHQLFLPES